MPKLNDPIRLNLLLDDFNASKFVLAHLYDDTGTELAGSPVAVPSIGNGIYRYSGVMMPNTPQVFALFLIYDDRGHTVLNSQYTGQLVEFNLDTGQGSPGVDIEVEMETSPILEVTMETTPVLQAIIGDE